MRVSAVESFTFNIERLRKINGRPKLRKNLFSFSPPILIGRFERLRANREQSDWSIRTCGRHQGTIWLVDLRFVQRLLVDPLGEFVCIMFHRSSPLLRSSKTSWVSISPLLNTSMWCLFSLCDAAVGVNTKSNSRLTGEIWKYKGRSVGFKYTQNNILQDFFTLKPVIFLE